MSVEIKKETNVSETDANATETSEVDHSETESTMDSESESRERLLAESKKWKARAINAEKANKEQQKRISEEQGKYKELYETEHKARKELSVKVIKEKINASVKSVAAKVGCIDPDAVLALGDMSLLQIDEDNGDVFGAEHFVEQVKKTKPYLFQALKVPTINAASPSGTVQAKKVTAADILKMPKAEQNKYWAQAMQKSNVKK